MMTAEMKIARRFCRLMNRIGYEDKVYDFPPDKVTRQDIPRMLAWVRMVRDTYYEDGHVNAELRSECNREWHTQVRNLNRFIEKVQAEWDALQECADKG